VALSSTATRDVSGRWRVLCDEVELWIIVRTSQKRGYLSAQNDPATASKPKKEIWDRWKTSRNEKRNDITHIALVEAKP